MSEYLSNPSLPGRLIEVRESAVTHWSRAGWEPASADEIAEWKAAQAPKPDSPLIAEIRGAIDANAELQQATDALTEAVTKPRGTKPPRGKPKTESPPTPPVDGDTTKEN